MSERVLPHDLDAEAAVISAMLLDRAALDIAIDLVKPPQFFSESNRRICEAITELASAGKPVDVVTTAHVLRDRGRLSQIGGAAYLAQLVDAVPAVANVATYAGIVRDKWRVRQLIGAAQKIAAEGFGPLESAQAFIDSAGQAVLEIANSGEQREIETIAEVVQKSYANLCAAEARGGAVELSTGLERLDTRLGGLSRGRLTVLAARPGMGKTSLATSIAENVAATVGPVAIFSLEMPKDQLGLRMGCARAKVSVHQGINGWLRDDDRTALLYALDELKALPIWIDDTPAISLVRLRSKARLAAAKAGRPLSLIVIDYLQLMSDSSDEKRTRDRQLSFITAGLKALAKEMDCAVLLLAQLNREVEQEKDKRPRLHHLRESGGIEQDADDVLFIYRDDYYRANSDCKGVAEIIIAKQRNGPTGVVKVGFVAYSTAFTNLKGHHDDDEGSEP